MRPASLCFNETISTARHGFKLFRTVSVSLDVKHVLVIVGNEETHISYLGSGHHSGAFAKGRFFIF